MNFISFYTCFCIFTISKFANTENNLGKENFRSVIWRILNKSQIKNSKLSLSLIKSWPCPIDKDIEPCKCTWDSYTNIYLDCSDVNTQEQLARIFKADFPKKEVKEFQINKTPGESGGIDYLPSGIFHDIYFEIVRLNGLGLKEIEEGVFTRSYDTLKELFLDNNKLYKFPFESLINYNVLETINLDHNIINNLPELISNSLKKLTINKNYGIKISNIAFNKLPNIEYISLEGNEIKEIQPNLFSMQSKLKTLKLGSNLLTGLDENAINPRGAIITLQLEHNQLVDINHDGIKGMDWNNGVLDFSYNQFTKLDEFNWKKVFFQLKKAASINFEGNPLICGNDICWILRDKSLKEKVTMSTECLDGTPLITLPANVFCE